MKDLREEREIIEALKKSAWQPPAPDDDFRRLVEKLNKAGVHVSSLQELKHNLALWKKSIPVLKESLSDVSSDHVREAIVRLLGAPFAKGIVEEVVINEFKTNKNEMVRWAAGSSLEILASPAIAEDLVDIAADASFGMSRQMVVYALSKVKSHPRAFETALKCLEDDDVVLHALTALKRMRRSEAIPRIQPLLSHSRASVRRRAREVIDALSRHDASGATNLFVC